MLSVVVQHQLSSLVEYNFASGAGKRKLSYVELYVFFQVFPGDELFATYAADVKLLLSVNCTQRGRICESKPCHTQGYGFQSSC